MSAPAGTDPEPGWLGLGRELRALAQIGLTFSTDPFDQQRYQRLLELAATLLARGTGLTPPTLLEAFVFDRGYATPKVDVRAAAFCDGRVLLVREVSDGAWTLPGGWADVNETPAQSAAREVREESGFEVRVVKLAAVYDYRIRNRPRHLDSIYKLFFICELTGGMPRTSLETSAAEFFERDALPPLSTGRTTREQIERMFAHARDPALPADFD